MATGTPVKLTLNMTGVSKQSPEHITFTACGRGRALKMVAMSPGTPTKVDFRRLSLDSAAPSSPGISEGSFCFDENIEDISHCDCSRPPALVLCCACGYTFVGRARKQCPAHKQIIHLMDTTICPVCKAAKLKEF